MPAFIISALVGVVCIALGISNRKGNLSTIHEYHRKRVKKEDELPFGKQVGLGTIIIGIGVILFSGLSALAVALENNIYTWIGTSVMIASLVAGGAISFKAMFKYNQGIF